MGVIAQPQGQDFSDVYDPQSGFKIAGMNREAFTQAYGEDPVLPALFDQVEKLTKIVQALNPQLNELREFKASASPVVEQHVLNHVKAEYHGALELIKQQYNIDVPEQYFARDIHPNLELILRSNGGDLNRKALADAWVWLNRDKIEKLQNRNTPPGNVVQSGQGGRVPPFLNQGSGSVGGNPSSSLESFTAAVREAEAKAG